MTNIFLPSCHAPQSSPGAGATGYFAIGTADNTFNLTEANLQVTWRNNGVFSNLYTRVQFNTASSGPSILNYRIGGANGNQTISVPASTNGEFTDAVHTDTTSPGNQINYQTVNGGGGTIDFITIGMQFAPTTPTDTINKLNCCGSLNDTSALTSYYNPPVGVLSKGTNEANAQFTNKTSATLQNLYVFVSLNTASIATVNSRIGGGNGNLTISITSGTTGVFEDTTHTDSVSSGNLINTALNASVVTSLTITNIAIDYLTTNNTTHYLEGLTTGTSQTANLTRYYPISGNVGTVGTTEPNNQLKTGLIFTASNLEAFVITNTLTATTTMKFRVATANGNQAISYGSGVTGYLEDTTHSDSVTASQEIDYQIITGATGTSIIISNIGFLATYPSSSSSAIATWAASSSFSAKGSSRAKTKATITGQSTASFSGVATRKSAATFSPHTTLSTVGKSTQKSNAVFNVSGVFSPKGTSSSPKSSATFLASSLLTVRGKEVVKSLLTITAQSSLIFSRRADAFLTATWSAHGVFTPKGQARANSIATYSPHTSLTFSWKSSAKSPVAWTPSFIFSAKSRSTTTGKAIVTFSPLAILSPKGAERAKTRAIWTSSASFTSNSYNPKKSAATWTANSSFSVKYIFSGFSTAVWMSHIIFNAHGTGEMVPYRYKTHHLIGDPFPQRIRVGVRYFF